MTKAKNIFSTLAIFPFLISACLGGQQTPSATQPPATEPPVTVLPALTEPPATEFPIPEPVDLAGPLMELGSRIMHSDGAILIAVPGGKFIMGLNNLGDKEREVSVGDFWMYGGKVTNVQYQLCVTSGKCAEPDLSYNPSFYNSLDGNLPVTGVNYEQAAAYCDFVHGRLPTEAEWEKAARGPDGNLFPWGDAAPACDLLNFNFCKGKPTDITDYPQGESYYGALDMSGNVREWVADWFQADYYDNAPDTDPLGPDFGEKRSVRGSSFSDSGDSAFSARRFQLKPTEVGSDLGFRCVVEEPTYFAPYCQTIQLYGANPNGGPSDDVIPLPANCEQPKLSSKWACPDEAVYITIDTYPLPQGSQLEVPDECQGGPPTYKCTGSGEVTISPQSCEIPPPPSGGQCAPGYTYDAQSNTCKGKGSGEKCLPGFNFDPVGQCCTSTNPSAAVYGICPPGFYQQGNACVPAGSNPPPLAVEKESFSPIDCSKPNDGGGDPGGGDPGKTPCVPVICSMTDPKCVPVTCP